jgi:haloalkane dehalogenase
MITKPLFWTLVTLVTLLIAGCSDDTDGQADAGLPDAALSDGAPADGALADGAAPACNSEPVLRKTTDGIEFVRTPEACFDGIPNFPYEPKYVEIDGLRQAYVEDGPATADPVLLLHGQPSWGYLYRKMIPVLSDAGHRVIAMDHLGTGRSDKPTSIKSYSYLGHIDRLEKFITALGLNNITLFCQDWGSLIGLHVAGKHPDWFARIVVGDGALPVIPAGIKPYPDVQDPDTIDDTLAAPFEGMPAQQVEFYNEDCTPKLKGDPAYFGKWMAYSMKNSTFTAAKVVEAMTWFDVPADEEAAYDAPFPSRIYMAGIRVFPSLANELGGANQSSWEGLKAFTKPFLTIWAGNDPGNLGQCSTQDNLICNVAGAKDQPHTRLPEASHFLQDDQGDEIAKRMVDFMSATPSYTADYTHTCGLPIAPDGTGTPCTDDPDCSALAAKKCVNIMGESGFCSVEGCTAGSCASHYLCCHDCSPAAEPMLPFSGSACFPASKTTPALTGLAGCTCD